MRGTAGNYRVHNGVAEAMNSNNLGDIERSQIQQSYKTSL